MRRLVLASALVLLAVPACKHPGSAKLEGHWRGVRAEGVSPESQNAANAFAGATEIVARGDQIAISTPASKKQQSAYTVDAEDKTSLVIHTEKDGVNARETFTFGDDGKSMAWKVDERRTITFQRVPDPK